MSTTPRTPVVRDLEDALGDVPDGAVVGVGGTVTANHPMALLRALLRRRPRDLTIVAPTAGLDVDLLVAAGCVARLVTSYVGAEALAGVGPAVRAAGEAGTLHVWDADEAHCAMGLRAAAQGLPFLPWRGGVGTDLPTANPDLVPFADPIRGEPLLAVPALRLDVALIHAETADAFGNVQFVGPGHMDPLIAAAADRVVVQVDRLVPNAVIRQDPGATRFWRDTTVTRAPWGTHPYSSAGIEADAAHLAAYAAAVRAAGKGDPDPLERHMQTYVYGPADHAGYLEAVGVRRLAELVQ